jgi:pimeloyl-ACP methyl ester carboxylesterase
MNGFSIKPFFSLALLLSILNSNAQQPVDTAVVIQAGGIKQWLTLKGTSVRNPILLFLHGGPGNSVMGYSGKFTNELQKHFVVVQWDQRETGKTAELNKSRQPLTVSLMEQDAIEIINYLRRQYDQDKIYLMGHSWGGFLGLLIATHHSELLNGFIAVCPMIYQVESERISLNWLKRNAADENNKAAISELSKVSIPFASGEQLYFHRKWLLHYVGGKFPSKSTVVSWSEKWLNLFNEASAVNFVEVAPSLDCPVYFFVGSRDFQTSTKLTTDYYNAVKAKEKKLFVFEGVAHSLPTSEPMKLQRTIIDEVLKTNP